MIKIPTTRLADRVAARILGIARRYQATETQNLGAAIDQGTQAPMGGVPAPDGLEESLVAKALDL